MLKRFWSIASVTCAVLMLSATLGSAASRSTIDQSTVDQPSFDVRSHRGTGIPAPPFQGSGSEPGDDDAPNRDGSWSAGGSPVVDGGKGAGTVQSWSLKYLGNGIRLHLLKYFSALR